MKSLNKIAMMCSMLFLMMFGMTTKAQELSADEIVKKSNAVGDTIQVCVVDMVDKSTGESSTFVAFDKTKNLFYMNFMFSIWVDEENSYVYDRENDIYYFLPLDSNKEVNEQEEQAFPTITVKPYDYYLRGEQVYQGVVCYKIDQHFKQTENIQLEESYQGTCYIAKDTFRIIGFENNDVVALRYSYPESLPESLLLSKEIKDSALLSPDYAFEKNGISYVSKYLKDKKKTVLYVAKSSKTYKKKTLTIPSTVNLNGKTIKVYGIDKKAFSMNSKIRKVIIGNNVSDIKEEAFLGCKKLNEVTLGDNVRTIGKKAFYNCKNLKNVKIKSKVVKKISKQAFYKNAKTLKVKVPRKKYSKYKKMLKKSKSTSKIVLKKM